VYDDRAPYDAAVQTDVLIPLKRLDAAKSRLAPALSVAERRRLMAAMVEHVARTAVAADAGRVVLVSSDPAAPALAGRLGIGCVSDAGLPWNPGLAHARARLPAPAGAVLYLAGDLPLVEVGDIAALIEAGGNKAAVVGRAHDGGTNALWVSPAAAFEPAFGEPASATVHAARALEAGLRVAVLDRPGIARDVDTPADLALARNLLHGAAGVI
jgi:2-phospho-L-lactate/phosphoenolpyruvate guanylyltransferase